MNCMWCIGWLVELNIWLVELKISQEPHHFFWSKHGFLEITISTKPLNGSKSATKMLLSHLITFNGWMLSLLFAAIIPKTQQTNRYNEYNSHVITKQNMSSSPWLNIWLCQALLPLQHQGWMAKGQFPIGFGEAGAGVVAALVDVVSLILWRFWKSLRWFVFHVAKSPMTWMFQWEIMGNRLSICKSLTTGG